MAQGATVQTLREDGLTTPRGGDLRGATAGGGAGR